MKGNEYEFLVRRQCECIELIGMLDAFLSMEREEMAPEQEQTVCAALNVVLSTAMEYGFSIESNLRLNVRGK